MDRPGLAVQDHAVDGIELAQLRQGHVDDVGALLTQARHHHLQRRADLRAGDLVGRVEVPHEADAQAPDAPVDLGGEAGPRGGCAAGVGRVVAGDHVQQGRGVRRGARHRPNMVQREGEREHPTARHQAIGRLQPDNPAGAGRVTDRAAGIGAERQREQPRGQPGAGAGGRPAGVVARVPRVACRREGQVEGRAANGEFMGGELAHHDRAGPAQPRHHRRIGRCHLADQDLGMAGGRQPADIDDVLDADRHAVQRPPAAPGGQFLFRLARRGQGGLRVREDEGVQRRVQRLDPGEE